MILEEGETPPTRSSSTSRQPPPSVASTFSLSPFPPRPGTSSSSSAAFARGSSGYHQLASEEMYEPRSSNNNNRASSPLDGGGVYGYSGGSSFEQFPRMERGGGFGGMSSWLNGRHLKAKLLLTAALASLAFLLHAHFFRPKHHGPPPWMRRPNPLWAAGLDRLTPEQAAAAAAAGLPLPPQQQHNQLDEAPPPPPPGKAPVMPPRPPLPGPVGSTNSKVTLDEIAQDGDDASQESEVPLAPLDDYISPRRAIPSSESPWAHLPRDWAGHAALSAKRFPVGRESSAMQDPPELRPPPASYLEKAYEFIAGLSAKGQGSGADAFDQQGRPLQVARSEIVLSNPGWVAPKLKVSDIGTTRDRTSQSNWPKVQATGPKGPDRSREQKLRQDWVKRAFAHAWEGYKEHAWGHDELMPVSESFKDSYNGWGATIVDALDTLLILGFEHEYNLARDHVRQLDFTFLSPGDQQAFSTVLPSLKAMDGSEEEDNDADTGPQVLNDDDEEGGGSPAWPGSMRNPRDVNYRSPSSIPTFETVIRYLGGLIAAYDLAQDPLMLQRAIELADWILPALGTEYGLLGGGGRYVLGSNPEGRASGTICIAETGSLTLELTRLSMITGDEVYFKAAQRITDTLDTHFDPAAEKMDMSSFKSRRGRLGTLLPLFVDPERTEVTGEFGFGAMADSYYEYLIKQAHLLSGSMDQYSRMYADAIDSAYTHLIKRVETVPGREDLTVFGSVKWGQYSYELQHLTCFAGGMMGLGAKLLNRPDDLDTAINVTEACTFAYESTATGIGPESLKFYAPTDTNRWEIVQDEDGNDMRAPRGIPAGVRSSRPDHIGRPETIESVFYMYRLTGDRKWQDRGWLMFTSWVEHALTPAGLADVRNVHEVPSAQQDGMQSFVLAETLKYYYLLFSDFDLISLDDYVLNTEAHPFLRPVKQKSVFSQGHSPTPGKFWKGPDPSLEPAPSFVEQKADGTPVQKWFRVQQAHGLARIKDTPPASRQPMRRPSFVKPTLEELQEAQRDRDAKLKLIKDQQRAKAKEELDKAREEEQE